MVSDSLVLRSFPQAWLLAIQAGDVVVQDELRVADGALPPPHVARRSLRLLDAGCAARWAVPYNIVNAVEQVVVGGCGFKGAPEAGLVEIGYAVAPRYRRRGCARFGLRQLQAIALHSREVDQIEARIAPDNHASMAVAAGVGFVLLDRIVDGDGEPITRWRWRCSR